MVTCSYVFMLSLLLTQDQQMDYECVLDIENQSVVVDASVEPDAAQPSVFFITCQPHKVRDVSPLRSGDIDKTL